jgi:hypothetical protein
VPAVRLRALLPGITDQDLAAAVAAVTTAQPVRTLDLASPWAPVNNLARVLDGVAFTDVFGSGVAVPLSRAEALEVPAVARARHIICGTVARIPLRAYRAGVRLEGRAEPGWINSTAGVLSSYHRALWTADDLLFYGWSCWSRTNGADGYPLQMDRIPMGQWSVDDAGRVLVADAWGTHTLVDQRTVCLIPGPHEGILTAAGTTIRHAADLQRAASTAARHPAAYMALVQESGTPLKLESDDPEEVTVRSTVADWTAARRSPTGGVGFVPLGLKIQELGTFDQHLVTEGRNAAAVDVARVCSLPADLLDAAGPSSLTYATTRDNDQRAIQYGVGLYLSSLSAHLSMNATTPQGQEVRYSLEDWLEDPTSTTSQPAAQPVDVSRETTPTPPIAVTSTRQELPA